MSNPVPRSVKRPPEALSPSWVVVGIVMFLAAIGTPVGLLYLGETDPENPASVITEKSVDRGEGTRAKLSNAPRASFLRNLTSAQIVPGQAIGDLALGTPIDELLDRLPFDTVSYIDSGPNGEQRRHEFSIGIASTTITSTASSPQASPRLSSVTLSANCADIEQLSAGSHTLPSTDGGLTLGSHISRVISRFGIPESGAPLPPVPGPMTQPERQIYRGMSLTYCADSQLVSSLQIHWPGVLEPEAGESIPHGQELVASLALQLNGLDTSVGIGGVGGLATRPGDLPDRRALANPLLPELIGQLPATVPLNEGRPTKDIRLWGASSDLMIAESDLPASTFFLRVIERPVREQVVRPSNRLSSIGANLQISEIDADPIIIAPPTVGLEIARQPDAFRIESEQHLALSGADAAFLALAPTPALVLAFQPALLHASAAPITTAPLSLAALSAPQESATPASQVSEDVAEPIQRADPRPALAALPGLDQVPKRQRGNYHRGGTLRPVGNLASIGAAPHSRLQDVPKVFAGIEQADVPLTRGERRGLQRRLALIGYNPRGVDGIFGPRSRRAIAAAQADAGLTATGFVDLKTQRMILRRSERSYAIWQNRVAKQRRIVRAIKEARARPILVAKVPTARNATDCARSRDGMIKENQSISCDWSLLQESLSDLFDIKG